MHLIVMKSYSNFFNGIKRIEILLSYSHKMDQMGNLTILYGREIIIFERSKFI